MNDKGHDEARPRRYLDTQMPEPEQTQERVLERSLVDLSPGNHCDHHGGRRKHRRYYIEALKGRASIRFDASLEGLSVVRDYSGEENFEMLLAWLDPDRECAATKLANLHGDLIKFFAVRGCPVAEELADVTIYRVISRIDKIVLNYVGDPGLFFYGNAHRVHNEWVHMPGSSPPARPTDGSGKRGPEYARLGGYLRRLFEPDRDLVVRDLLVRYHRERKCRQRWSKILNWLKRILGAVP
jgi:hypothetical protein